MSLLPTMCQSVPVLPPGHFQPALSSLPDLLLLLPCCCLHGLRHHLCSPQILGLVSSLIQQIWGTAFFSVPSWNLEQFSPILHSIAETTIGRYDLEYDSEGSGIKESRNSKLSLTGTSANIVLKPAGQGHARSGVPVTSAGLHLTQTDHFPALRFSSHLQTLEAGSVWLQTPRKRISSSPHTLLTQGLVLTSFQIIDAKTAIPFWCVVGPLGSTRQS